MSNQKPNRMWISGWSEGKTTHGMASSKPSDDAVEYVLAYPKEEGRLTRGMIQRIRERSSQLEWRVSVPEPLSAEPGGDQGDQVDPVFTWRQGDESLTAIVDDPEVT